VRPLFWCVPTKSLAICRLDRLEFQVVIARPHANREGVKIKYFKYLTVFLVLGIAGCSSDDGAAPPPPNKKPTLTFTVAERAIGRSESKTFSATVSDPEDEMLTVTWTIVRDGNLSGTIISQVLTDGTAELQWIAPVDTGEDTITVRVADPHGASRSVTQTIKVATVRFSIAASATWDAANSPYLLRPPTAATISVPAGNTLVIDPGVEVYADKPGLIFDVAGVLNVNGTFSEPVMFGFNSTAPLGGDWDGFQVKTQGAGQATMIADYATIQHAKDGVKSAGNAIVELTNSMIRFCSNTAVNHVSSGNTLIRGCVIRDNRKVGIRVADFITVPPDGIRIISNLITANGSDGGEGAIYMDFDDPTAAIPIRIEGNNIARNFGIGIVLETAAFPTINGNGIFSNTFGSGGVQNLRLVPGFDGVPLTIDATGNFWTLTTQPDIKATVHDREDKFPPDIDVTVDVSGWLTACPTMIFPFNGEPACQ
jgi:parallel beta-helix repeat protein